LLKEQLQVLEERTKGLEDRERVLQETLVTTHKVVEDMKEGARKEAALVVREAELDAEKNLEGARAQVATMQAEVAALKRTRQQLTESLRSTVEMYGRLLNQEDARADEADGKT
jgi:cell division initiation protein